MLSDQEFNNWCQCLHLSEATKAVVQQIRSREPVRRVGGGGRNVCGRYPSHKMGRTIQFESHKVELPAIEEYEDDDDVLEYYDQPLQLTLSYQSKSGRTVVCSHVPDFFVLRQSEVGFEEWKTEERLKRIAQKQPNRYSQEENGHWHSPPVQAYAQELGVYYRLRVDSEIDWIYYRNRQFLKSYLSKGYMIAGEISALIVSIVTDNPGITLAQLLESALIGNADDIYALISAKQVYVDLKAASLTEPERVYIFTSQQMAEAHALLVPHEMSTTTVDSLKIINVAVGTHLKWDGKSLSVLQMGKTKVVLRGESELIQLTIAEFDSLIQQGEITNLAPESKSIKDTEAWEQLIKASPEDLEVANYRYRVIKRFLQGHALESVAVSERTIRNWKSLFNAAQESCGLGYIGLLPKRAAKGNRCSRLSTEAWEFVDKIIEEHYENFKQRRKLAAYGILVREWEKARRIDPCPSRTTFCKRINQRSGYRQTRARQGSRAAYQQLPFYHALTLSTPVHGNRPFEICHIDHTQLDIELVCSRTGLSLGRPWATILIDAFSRRILAVYLTFDPPSYRSCMMVLRICVQRFGRFPETLVVDNGAEFGSIYFETLLAAFSCTKKQRPTASPRFGSIVERLFGTTHTEFFYNLQGNTQITKRTRQVTKANDPKGQAIWTLALLYEHFCGYAYEFYDQRKHPALGQSPREAFAMGLEQSGMRLQQKVLYDENFQIFTLPSTPKGTAKVQPRIGVKINYLYYWSTDDSFLNPNIEGTQVPVRYDPFDVGTAYAYVNGRWVRCICEQYSYLQGHTERELQLASTELRKQKKQYANAVSIRSKDIAHYLESAEAQEALQQQRLHDLALADVQKYLRQEVVEQSQLKNKNEQTNNTHVSCQLEQSSTESINFKLVQPYKLEELW